MSGPRSDYTNRNRDYNQSNNQHPERERDRDRPAPYVYQDAYRYVYNRDGQPSNTNFDRASDAIIAGLFSANRTGEVDRGTNTQVFQKIKKGRFNEALQDVDKALGSYKKINSFLLSGLMQSTSNTVEWEKQKEIFHQAPAEYISVEVYNAIISQGETHADFEEAQRAYTGAVEKRKTNTFTFNIFIKAADKANQIGPAKLAYEQSGDQADGYTFGSITTAINNATKRELTERLPLSTPFEYVRQIIRRADASTNKMTAASYNNYIISAGYASNYEEALYAFNRTKVRFPDNATSYNNYIKVAGQLGHYQEAKEAYGQITTPTGGKREFSDAFTYSHMIVAATENHDTPFALQVYETAKNRNQLDPCIINDAIVAALKGNEIIEATRIFQYAIEHKRLNEIIVANFIAEAGNAGRIDLCQWAFNLASPLGKCNLIVVGKTIESAGKAHRFDLAYDMYMHAKRTPGLGSNSFILYTLLNIPTTSPADFELKKTVLRAASPEELDYRSFSTLLTQAGEQGKVKDAWDIFIAALKANKTHPYLYNMMIKTAVDLDCFDIAHEAFKRAVKYQTLDNYTFTLFIQAASANDQLGLAIDAFSTANKLNLVDGFILETLIVEADKHNNFALADDLYKYAIDHGIKDPVVFNNYIKAAGHAKRHTEAANAYRTVTNDLKIATEFTFRNLIYCLNVPDHIETAKEALDEAERRSLTDPAIYNAFIIAADQAGRFDLVQAAFKTAIDRHHFDASTFRVYIHAAQHANRFDLAFDAFKEGKRIYPNATEIFNYFIKAAGHAKDFESAQAAFKEASDLGIADQYTFINLMKAAATCEMYETVHSLYIQATLTFPSPRVELYNCYISSLNPATDFDKILTAFNHTINPQNEIADSYTFNTMLFAIGKTAFNDQTLHTTQQLLLEIFNDAKNRNLANMVTYNAFIASAFHLNLIDEATTALQEVIDLGKADPSNFASYIKAATDQGHYDLALDCYRKALEERIVNIQLFHTMIATASKQADFNTVLAAYNTAKAHECIDATTIVLFMQAASKAERFDLAHELFKESKGLKHQMIFNSFITIASEAGFFPIAEQTYQEAIQEKIANGLTYSAFIRAAALAGNLKKAKAAYDESRALGHINVLTYSNYMCAASLKGDFQQVELAFAEAKAKHLVDSYTYNEYIIAASKAGNFEKAQALFMEAKTKYPRCIAIFDSFIKLAGKTGRGELAHATFGEACNLNIAVASTYAAYISAMGTVGRIDLAANTYQSIPEPVSKDSKVHASYILALGKAGYIDNARAAFEQARKLKDKAIYVNLMKVAIYLGYYHEVDAIFEEAKAENLLSADIYLLYIEAAVAFGKIDKAMAAYKTSKEAFETLVKIDLADVNSFTIFIQTAKQVGSFEDAKTAFQKAKALGLLTASIYKAFIDVSLVLGGGIRNTMMLFEEAKASGLVTVDLYNSMILKLGNSGHYHLAEQLFTEAKTNNIANAKTFANFIKSADNAGLYSKANEAYIDAGSRLLLNADIFNAHILAAGHEGKYDEAEKTYLAAQYFQVANIETDNAMISSSATMFYPGQIFEKACKANTVSLSMYCAFIRTAGSLNLPKLAHDTFSEGLKKFKGNVLLYNSMLFAARSSKRFSAGYNLTFKMAEAFGIATKETYAQAIALARDSVKAGTATSYNLAFSTFETAKSKQLVDKKTYNYMIDVMFDNGEFDNARALYNESRIRYVETTDENNRPLLDVNLQSFGAANFSVEKFINLHPSLTQFSINPGKGPEKVGNFLLFKMQLKASLTYFYQDWDITLDGADGERLLMTKARNL